MLADDPALTNLGYAGAFIGGLIVGGLVVARITRIVMEYLKREREK